MMQVLKQGQYAPLPVEEQVLEIFAVTQGYSDDVPAEEVPNFCQKLTAFIRQSQPKIMAEIREKKQLSPELIEQIKKAILEFKQG